MAGAWWERGFRVFFLLASLHAVLAVPFWLAMLTGRVPAPRWLAPNVWHGHEMLFGFVAAAVAGFLLTSVPVWTGSAPLRGGRLAALAGIWLVGRVAMGATSWLPRLAVAGLDLAFLPLLALAVARPIRAARQRRNFGFPVLLAGLAGANLCVHGEAFGVGPGASYGLRLGVDCIAVLLVVIGGRITPLFTQNALHRAGVAVAVRSSALLDRAAVVAVAALPLLDLVAPASPAAGATALGAGVLVALRMSGWRSLHTGSDPLLWSLHLGYAWTALGLICLGLSDLTSLVPGTTGLHALTAGAFGATILAVMTRVSLGHTGRPLVVSPVMTGAFVLVSLGAALRVAGPWALPGQTLAAWMASGLLWSAAFALFAVVHAPVLARPRIDGRPG